MRCQVQSTPSSRLQLTHKNHIIKDFLASNDPINTRIIPAESDSKRRSSEGNLASIDLVSAEIFAFPFWTRGVAILFSPTVLLFRCDGGSIGEGCILTIL